MPSLLNAELNTSTSPSDSAMHYLDDIIGAATFDLNGLPKVYFTTSDSSNMSWVQTIFQALGLRSLLASSLRLEGFHHATIQGAEYCAVIVKQRNQYIALLLKQTDEISVELIEWAQSFEATTLQANSRFTVA